MCIARLFLFSSKLHSSVNYMIHVFFIIIFLVEAMHDIYLIHVHKSYIYTHTSFRKKSIYFIYNTFFFIWNPSIWSLSKDFLSVSVFHIFFFSLLLLLLSYVSFHFFRGLLLTLKFLPIIKYVISFFMPCKKRSLLKKMVRMLLLVLTVTIAVIVFEYFFYSNDVVNDDEFQ